MTPKTHPSKTLSLVLALLVVAAGAQAAPGPYAHLKLKGIDPSVYLLKRNHKPDVSGELRRLPVDVSLAVLQDPGAFLVVEDGRYPVGLKPEERARLRSIEKRALVQGALTSLADRSDPRAFAVLQKHLGHDDVAVAALAAERMGEIDDAGVVDVLAGLLKDPSTRLDVRAGAAAGLGRHRSETSLEALLPALSSSNKPELRIAVIRALGSLSSRWAWEAKSDAARGTALRARVVPALEGVAGGADVVAARDEVLKMLK
jgi:hypothetical protein